MRSLRGGAAGALAPARAAVPALVLALALSSCQPGQSDMGFRKHVQLHFAKQGHVIYCEGASLSEFRFVGSGLGRRIVRDESDLAEVDVEGAGTVLWGKNSIAVNPGEVRVNGQPLVHVVVLLQADQTMSRGFIKTWAN
ncbi:MAG: hypothetical protein HYZ53_06820 [Planctomycetes bacterium]|nr:hypothetical protein [Planctomycetota bacterium]